MITDEMRKVVSASMKQSCCLRGGLMCGARREGSCETCDKIADGVLELTVPLISPLIRAADAARIAELEAALAPFKRLAVFFDEHDDDKWVFGPDNEQITAGDFRRTAAVMEGKP
jgi:hypothetical protein